jgi:hypothetical protein
MSRVLQALPGEWLAIPAMNRQLRTMWNPGGSAEGAPSEFRASQMNLLLHFGPDTEPGDARARFDEAIVFSQRYPCRIIVLCADAEEPVRERVEGKLFAQCYIGDTPRTMCCCEALAVAFDPAEAGAVFNQVSVWIESDLPSLLWLHRIDPDSLGRYLPTLGARMRRILFDRSVEGGAVDELARPEGSRWSDLAEARTLPLRQSLGQYLSCFPPGELARQGRAIAVGHGPGLAGEAHALARWMAACLEEAGGGGRPGTEVRPVGSGRSIEVEWRDAAGEPTLLFRADLARGHGTVEARWAGEHGPAGHTFVVDLLAARETLGEAIFF